MKKLTLLFLVFVFLPCFLDAKTVEDDRRIEEEKREDFLSTEVEISREKQPLAEPAEFIDLDYFRELFSKRVALNSDACKALVILMGSEGYIIPKEIAAEFALSQPLHKGLAAYMFCRALKIKGGIWLRLLGMNQRYALKELVFEGIMSAGSVNDIMSGKELILTFTRAVDYITTKTTNSRNKTKPRE